MREGERKEETETDKSAETRREGQTNTISRYREQTRGRDNKQQERER